MSIDNIAAFWHRAPSAMFPICLGAIGAGLLWRKAAETLGAPAAIGEIWLALAIALSSVCAVFYARRLALRPAAILDDLGPVPARAAVSAASMCMMLTAAALVPYAPGLAALVLLVGVAHHLIHAGMVLWVLVHSPPEERVINPTLYLPFVGQIVAPIAGVPLGYWTASAVLYWSAVAAWVVITAVSLQHILSAPIPKPLRQGMVIFLAPSGVGVISADLLDASWSPAMMVVFGVAVAGFAIWLATRIGWLVAGGWTPAWGAFTFPTVALAGAAMIFFDRVAGGALSVLGWPFLLGCSATVLVVLGGAIEAVVTGRRYF
jgi:tellurite resistance protein